MLQTPDSTGSAVILKALAFAAEKHRKQTRKDAAFTPYIYHPIRVAHVLASTGNVDDPSTLAAALLHDTIEDTETAYAELVESFGSEIANIVLEVTDDKSLDKMTRKLRAIANAHQLSSKAKMVRLADKICNMTDILHTPPTRWPLDSKQRYFDWARQVVAYGLRGTNPALDAEFDRVYLQRPQFNQLALETETPGTKAWARILPDGSFELESYDYGNSSRAKHERTSWLLRIESEKVESLAQALQERLEEDEDIDLSSVSSIDSEEEILATIAISFYCVESVLEWFDDKGIRYDRRTVPVS